MPREESNTSQRSAKLTRSLAGKSQPALSLPAVAGVAAISAPPAAPSPVPAASAAITATPACTAAGAFSLWPCFIHDEITASKVLAV